MAKGYLHAKNERDRLSCLAVIHAITKIEAPVPHNSRAEDDHAKFGRNILRGHVCAIFHHSCSKLAYTFSSNSKLWGL